jgi:hypothetical protein
MCMNINKLKKLVMTVKFYIQRSASYLSVINACMILVVMIRTLDLPLQQYLPLLISIGAVGLVVWGYIDNKWGLYHEEVLAINRRNPVQIKMFKRFDDLEQRLIKIELDKK